MINVSIEYDSQGKVSSYEIKGHSKYDQYGRDIVCAAVSILGQNTVFALVEVGGIDEDKLKYKKKSGYLYLELPKDLDQETELKAQVILDTFVLGIKNIEKNYSEYIRLSIRRCKDV